MQWYKDPGSTHAEVPLISTWGSQDFCQWPPWVHVCGKALQLCLTLYDPMDYSPPGSSVHGILQARILEWVAMPSSRESSWPRDRNCVSCNSCNAGGFFTVEPPGNPPWLCERTEHSWDPDWVCHRASLVSQWVKSLPAMWESRVWSLGWDDPLEKEMATHSSILAWRIPWTE